MTRGTQTPTLCFDGFELRRADRLVLRDGNPLRLGSRAFDLLLALADRAGSLVTKEELLSEVWRGRVVEESNIATQIATLRRTLGRDYIATVQGHGYRFAGEVMTDSSQPPTASNRAGSTPLANRSTSAAGKLIGRDDVLKRLDGTLGSPGCVTLLGPAGVGKTSVAREIFTRNTSRAFWIDLSVLTDGTQVMPTMLRAMAVSTSGSEPDKVAARALAGSSLLVFDNAEHVVASVGEVVQRLLSVAPHLAILVTSQVRLAIVDERCEHLQPLALLRQARDSQSPEAPAVTLLIQRVHSLNPGFVFLQHGMELVRDICKRLDGLPLAIEMAAARIPLLGIEEVHAAIADRFVALRLSRRDAPARHRTLGAALDWSYQMLSASERALLRRLSVCSGTFSADLAVKMSNSDRWDALDQIESLVDHSLVSVDAEDPPRYRLLETIREYSFSRLQDTEEDHAARFRLAQSMVELLALANGPDAGPLQETTRASLLAEMDNVRQAMDWSVIHAPEVAMRLSAYASAIASMTPWRVEAFRWLQACEQAAAADDIDLGTRALWARHYAAQSLFFGDPQALQRTTVAVALSRQCADPLLLAFSLIYAVRASQTPSDGLQGLIVEARGLVDLHLGAHAELHVLLIYAEAHVHGIFGRWQDALRRWDDARALAHESGLHVGEAMSALKMADALRSLGEHDEALQILGSVPVHQSSPYDSLHLLHAVARIRILGEVGRWAEAAPDLQRVLQVAIAQGSAETLHSIATQLTATGYPRAAAQLLGMARQAFEDQLDRPHDYPMDDWQRASIAPIEMLGSVAFEKLVTRGRHLEVSRVEDIMLADEAVKREAVGLRQPSNARKRTLKQS